MPPANSREPGTRFAPQAFRDLGLHQALSPAKTTVVEARVYSDDRGRRVNVRNMQAIAEHAARLCQAIEVALSNDAFVLVLGGDCSLLIGSMLANAHRGSPALLFIDGHSDFYLPEQSHTGGAAGMDLALVMGWGPGELTNLAGKGPYVAPQRVAVLGNRAGLAIGSASLPALEETGVFYAPLQSLREIGVEQATRHALAKIRTVDEPYWVHLDVDVIDSALMPAVDSPQADGLTWQELETLLEVALDGNACGLQVTIYDPTCDPGFIAGKTLVEALVRVLAPRISSG
ncbi:arginase family protein [Devosia albogilva]|uniref:Arginase family protein n=1 Tax=Devosia albogilva TaxID=429726 RepID=A0ABW5QII9_9HYPH